MKLLVLRGFNPDGISAVSASLRLLGNFSPVGSPPARPLRTEIVLAKAGLSRLSVAEPLRSPLLASSLLASSFLENLLPFAAIDPSLRKYAGGSSPLRGLEGVPARSSLRFL